jgi:hypothetical protein
MSVRVIHGKPGSGKTCYCVSLLMKEFGDWVRFERSHGERFARELFTNIPLNVEAINEFLVRSLLIRDVDVSPYIHSLGADFFTGQFSENDYFPDIRNGDKPFSELTDEERSYWWYRFPTKSLIVIDEVHHYLPSGRVTGEDLRGQKEFMNYISTHRHREQDLILLTQHVGNISYEIKKQVEVINEVVNIKNAKVGVFPFTIPMADIDVVRSAWGIPQQLAHVKRGVCEASRILYDKDPEIFVLTKELFRLYQSHTLSSESLDRPSLNLTRLGSLFWLFRRHVFRLGLASLICFGIVWGFFTLLYKFPTMLFESLGTSSVSAAGSPPMSGSPVTVPTSISDRGDSFPSVSVDKITVPPDSSDYQVLGFFRSSVMTNRGVLRVGDVFKLEGNDEIIQSINFKMKTVFFKSGKKVSK